MLERFAVCFCRSSEFREFIARGNVVDLAVGVVIGGAFGKIVTSLVGDLIMPPIGLLLGGIDFSSLRVVLKPADLAAKSAEVAIRYGVFINTRHPVHHRRRRHLPGRQGDQQRPPGKSRRSRAARADDRPRRCSPIFRDLLARSEPPV